MLGYCIDRLSHNEPYCFSAGYLANFMNEYGFASLAQLLQFCKIDSKPIKNENEVINRLVGDGHRVVNVQGQCCIILGDHETWDDLGLQVDDVDDSIVLENDEIQDLIDKYYPSSENNDAHSNDNPDDNGNNANNDTNENLNDNNVVVNRSKSEIENADNNANVNADVMIVD